MASIARILGVSLLVGWLVAQITFTLLRHSHDCGILCLVLGSLGALVGAIAGSAFEIVTAVRQRSPD